jgi:hypothetical protein
MQQNLPPHNGNDGTAGADHAQIECGLHESVVQPVQPGTVLVKYRARWYYYADIPTRNINEGVSVDGIVGVVSTNPFHPIDQPGPNEFMRCVSGTCPARVPPEQYDLIKEALESSEVLLCVTKTTEKGCMEMYSGQADCEVVGYVGSRTKYRQFTNVPYYQECDGCFHLNINANTAELLKQYHKLERKVWWEKKMTSFTNVFVFAMKICLVVGGFSCALLVVMANSQITMGYVGGGTSHISNNSSDRQSAGKKVGMGCADNDNKLVDEILYGIGIQLGECLENVNTWSDVRLEACAAACDKEVVKVRKAKLSVVAEDELLGHIDSYRDEFRRVIRTRALTC